MDNTRLYYKIAMEISVEIHFYYVTIILNNRTESDAFITTIPLFFCVQHIRIKADLD